MSEQTRCEMCQRETRLTKHHLIPKSRHKNKKNKKNFSRDEVHARVIWICRPCHSNIHAQFTEKELEYDFNTLEKLMAHPKIQKFTDFVASQPPGKKIPMATKKKRR